ncbi:MAG: hypothetical protein HYR94_14500 [Chloroflexi bacterium]|nr:hypothetical protein [Chloroflexota bacterium]
MKPHLKDYAAMSACADKKSSQSAQADARRSVAGACPGAKGVNGDNSGLMKTWMHEFSIHASMKWKFMEA